MDNKNVFVAIALSMSVLLFWGAFLKRLKNKPLFKIRKRSKCRKRNYSKHKSKNPEKNPYPGKMRYQKAIEY